MVTFAAVQSSGCVSADYIESCVYPYWGSIPRDYVPIDGWGPVPGNVASVTTADGVAITTTLMTSWASVVDCSGGLRWVYGGALGEAPLFVGNEPAIWDDDPDWGVPKAASTFSLLEGDRVDWRSGELPRDTRSLVDCGGEESILAWFDVQPVRPGYFRADIHIVRTGTVMLSEGGIGPCEPYEVDVDLLFEE